MKATTVFYDNLYGFIKLNQVESEILKTPYFQRLRWIRQLGFSEYVFPGAVHTRLTHQIGVLHVADQMLRAIGKAVPEEKLFDAKAMDDASEFHKSVRIAAMLHDIGHFPFSHTTEVGYLMFGNSGTKVDPSKQHLANSHEHLGSYIIKNTDFRGGITYILKKYGFDYKEISKLVKGESSVTLGNQILHSEVDADRMDYLVRDAYHTGIRYGNIDREYIVHHLTTFDLNGTEVLAFNENARHAVEDLLHARFSWYSQVIKDSGGAKFDVVAGHLTKFLLEKNWIYRFQDLLTKAKSDPEEFFGFNDFYFMNLVYEKYRSGEVKAAKPRELMRALLFREAPMVIHAEDFESKIYPSQDQDARKALEKKVRDRVEEFNKILKKHGTGEEWIMPDIPEKDVIFAQSYDRLMKKRKKENLLMERDSVKILDKKGKPVLLVEKENSTLSVLSRYSNFIPNIYCNRKAFRLLKEKKAIP